MSLSMKKGAALGAACAAALLGIWACSGSSSNPGAPSNPAPTPTPPAAPTPSASPPPATASCPRGTLDAACRRTSPRFLKQVDDAISQLVKDQPGIFDLNDTAGGPGNYRVRDTEAYFAGVIKNLQATGLCAGFDLVELQVKDSNESSEQYDILLGSGHVRRGDGSYRATCTPAVFPVDPSEFIDSIRVAFFGISCPGDRVPPRNGDRQLPVGCVGFVTATPKDKNGKDVDPRIHGPHVVWALKGGSTHVSVEDVPNQDFNKNVYGVAVGPFTICAEVRGIQGCLTADVIP